MVQSELIERMAKRLNMPKKHVRIIFKVMRDEMLQALEAGEDVWLRNLMRIVIRQDPQVIRTDPRGNTKIVPAQNRVIIRPGIDMKEAVGQHYRSQSGRWA